MLASQFVLEWNHWIAFILLVFLGGRMIIEGFRGDSDEARGASPPWFLAAGHHRLRHQP
jgi:putative Mn2+ efflux pump MntP